MPCLPASYITGEAPVFVASLDDVTVMRELIQQRSRHLGVCADLGPIVKASVRCFDRTFFASDSAWEDRFVVDLSSEGEVRRFEVITGGIGRRRWSIDERARSLEETLVPGAV